MNKSIFPIHNLQRIQEELESKLHDLRIKLFETNASLYEISCQARDMEVNENTRLLFNRTRDDYLDRIRYADSRIEECMNSMTARFSELELHISEVLITEYGITFSSRFDYYQFDNACHNLLGTYNTIADSLSVLSCIDDLTSAVLDTRELLEQEIYTVSQLEKVIRDAFMPMPPTPITDPSNWRLA